MSRAVTLRHPINDCATIVIVAKLFHHITVGLFALVDPEQIDEAGLNEAHGPLGFRLLIHRCRFHGRLFPVRCFIPLPLSLYLTGYSKTRGRDGFFQLFLASLGMQCGVRSRELEIQ